MPLYQVAWSEAEAIGPRHIRKIVASGPIAAALKIRSARQPIDVEVEQLDSDLAWSDKREHIAPSIVPRTPGGRSVKLSVPERFALAEWLKLPVGNGFIVADGRLVVDPQQDGGMAVRVFAL